MLSFAFDVLFLEFGLVLVLLVVLDYSASITHPSCLLCRTLVLPNILQILLLHVLLHSAGAAVSQLPIYSLATMAIVCIFKLSCMTIWHKWCHNLLGAHTRCWQKGWPLREEAPCWTQPAPTDSLQDTADPISQAGGNHT